VLRDALALLSSPNLRVGRGGKEGADAVTEEELVTAAANGHAAAAAQQGMEAAKGRLLCKMSRKQLMEHVVPIVLQLKEGLEKAHSPLLGDLMAFLAELARAHRGEVRAVLAAVDPGLGKEVEYDLKQFDKQQKLHAASQEAAAAQRAKALLSPALALGGGLRTVGFASPSGRAATGTGTMPKSALKGSAVVSALKGLATPKLKGLATTPKTDRAGRTPTAALSAALSAKRKQNVAAASAAEGEGGEADNGMISTAGLPEAAGAPPLSPVPFRIASVRLEPRPAARVWAVALPDASHGSPAPSGRPGSDENRRAEPNAMRPPASKAKRGAAESPPAEPSSPVAAVPGKQAAEAKTPGSARRGKKKANLASSPVGQAPPVDSLQGMARAPSHRTPGDSARKKKTKA
jgi:hypothetical protein